MKNLAVASLADIAILSLLSQETYNFGGNWHQYIRELSCSSRDDLQLSLGISHAPWPPWPISDLRGLIVAARNGAIYLLNLTAVFWHLSHTKRQRDILGFQTEDLPRMVPMRGWFCCSSLFLPKIFYLKRLWLHPNLYLLFRLTKRCLWFRRTCGIGVGELPWFVFAGHGEWLSPRKSEISSLRLLTCHNSIQFR